ncbi:hypothetical protein CQW23_06083 [Capsicum baccatum]|uniref:Uncharacterized protein n=1 Tax=Capsicum baccatum TaxID=33114 RepID=A0A2G2X2F4_CAPBA|nr:hypothetical protein CQW23_06083 [Capsicum baccatum]
MYFDVDDDILLDDVVANSILDILTPSADTHIRHPTNLDDSSLTRPGDISIKLGEMATTIGRRVDSRLDVIKLNEEVMAIEGYNEEFLGDTFDNLVQIDT